MDQIKENIIKEINNKITNNVDDIFVSLENDEPIILLNNFLDNYKDDQEIMLGIMQSQDFLTLLSYCSNRLRNDPLFVYEALKIQIQNFSQASIELQNNKDFVLKCIELPKFLIEDAPEHFLDDKDCAIAAIKRKGVHSLKIISDRLKDDKEIAIAAINHQPDCYQYISTRLQYDKDIILLALKDEALIKYIPLEYRDNKKIMLEFFNIKHLNPQNIQNLQYVSKRLKNDAELVISALKTDGLNLQYAGEKLKNNKDIAILSIKNNGSLKFLNAQLRNDKEIVSIACEKNKLNIQYASVEIREEIGDSHPVHFIKRQKMHDEITKKLPLKDEMKVIKKKI